MSQVMRGLILGTPGVPANPSGSSNAICDLFGNGSPVTSTDPFVVKAGVGSTYRDYVGGQFWFRQVAGWAQVTVP